MSNALEPLGVSFRAEDLYRVCLRMPEVSQDEWLAASAYSVEEFEMLVEELVYTGLLRRTEAGLTVIPPTRAIHSLIGNEQNNISDRLNRLERARSALQLYASEYRPADTTTSFAEIIDYNTFNEKIMGIVSDADTPINIIYYRLKPELEERIRVISQVMLPGKDFRLLLPAEHVNDDQVIEAMRKLLRPGVEVRFAAKTITSLTIFGDVAASTLTDPSDYFSDRLLIRTTALVSIFRDYFDAIWRVGIPLAREKEDDVDEVLLLMAQGLKDEAIAAQLDMSLRTVRRRIADVMDMVGADSRFQAGLEVARRGLI
jgi:DNA-binding CsgD family transcriptional regulator